MSRTRAARDRGSVTPLIIGMAACLLLLSVGVTAAGSAFLAGQRLQRLCDGAAAAAAGAVDRLVYADGGVRADLPIGPAAVTAARDHLAVRGPDVAVSITAVAGAVTATCSNQAPIAFGALFGASTLDRTVTASARPAV
ncbi:pilus assembly protein TadG-related protein [Nakamurella leprariae]|uniref:Putative Flp pilus-assembly TadG-like N-terminal domain-containing protein n=1 Tax=Nakamurella leprariae TaxID=2803911 RepID=A0A939BVZ2_9ACTN|nr:pilus assembly protein TadG-related protein [Nakamurella leprariae]MBM9467018.1 hypothetical protein [Nakamurella leprariae]